MQGNDFVITVGYFLKSGNSFLYYLPDINKYICTYFSLTENFQSAVLIYQK